MSDLPDIPSPCVGICAIDPKTKTCNGCLRSPKEIAAWPRASNEERLAIVGELRKRRRQLGRTSPRDMAPRRRRRS